MLKTILEQRNVPALKPRDEMISVLLEEVYGNMPLQPDRVVWREEPHDPGNFCAGKATFYRVDITGILGDWNFTFPAYCAVPTAPGKHPFFVHVNFRDAVPDRYMPTEELIDNGFAVLSFCYTDVTSDDSDFTDGFAGVLYPDGQRKPNDPGKIAMWAWAVSRVMDYAQSLEMLDLERGCVCGHSRLGKTALLAGALDTRFRFVYSNDSGCSGAAITREKTGERVADICRVFPFWFCENYRKYMGREEAMPFDQHYLLAAIAPRFVCVGSAVEDTWADPVSEMLGCAAANGAYEQMGMTGFVAENRLPQIGDQFFEGHIGYHLRAGTHFFSREDWQKLIAFIQKH